MIELHAKIHDRFSIEFKIGFVARKRREISDFVMSTWIFIPGTLDINPFTYGKDAFYRDIKSYLRLITPVYPLAGIARPGDDPARLLEEAARRLLDPRARPDDAARHRARVNMFASILKSALRDELAHVKQNPVEEDTRYLCREYARDVARVTTAYRRLGRLVNLPTVPRACIEHHRTGDEFISNAIEQNTHALLAYLDGIYPDPADPVKEAPRQLLRDEVAYKRARGYPRVKENDDGENRDFIARAGLLKRHVEADLFLAARKRSNTFVIEQLLFSLAAGLAMIFATAVAFAVQREYGNFTMPLFVALVVSYMLKDRIKELARHYFAHNLGTRYFDHKTRISHRETPLGWSKEGVDFIAAGKVPAAVTAIRDRSPLPGERGAEEKVLLYRERVQFKRKQLPGDYSFPGIHDIIRFNVSEFCRKMDNPAVPLHFMTDTGERRVIQGDKVYYLNFIMQCRYEKQLEYKRYRVVFNRAGIISLDTP
ncbi:MAG: hypothetical protein LBK12_03160 [Odoribacteraceae bacterium]|jgi:hypothetical protein|nr:hypothetical protein [Odoribacteraceae bacterium]